MTDAPITHLKPSQIEVVEDFNPRTLMDAEQLEQLTASIKADGIIQPLLVAPTGDGGHTLIAGHRRLAAAKKAKLKEVPVFVRSVNGDAKALAVIENLQREDLNPIDEARGIQQVMEIEGLNQKQVADRIKASTTFVSDRLRLLKLPEAVQKVIQSGDVPPAVGPFLDKLAAVSVPAAEVAAKLFAGGKHDATKMGDRYAADRFLSGLAQAAGTGELQTFVEITDGGRLWFLADGLLPKELHTRLSAARDDYSVPYNDKPHWRRADIDAARQYGCLFEHKAGSHSFRYVTDPEFVRDRVEQMIVRFEKARAKAKKAAESKSDKSADDDKAARAAERERQRVEALEAQAFNEDLGAALASKFVSLDVTLDRLRAIALMLVNSSSSDSIAGGMAFTDVNLQDKEVKTLKSGESRTKLTLIPIHSAHEELRCRIVAAQSAEELMGVLMTAFVASLNYDDRAVSRSAGFGYHWTPPGGHYGDESEYNPRPLIQRDAVEVLTGEARDRVARELEDPEDTDDDE